MIDAIGRIGSIVVSWCGDVFGGVFVEGVFAMSNPGGYVMAQLRGVPGVVGELGPLALKRTPEYLRFVMVGEDWSTLDALDCLDDEPKVDEWVLVSRRVGRSIAHVDRVVKGRRVGEVIWMAVYELVVDGEMITSVEARDVRKWRSWCKRRSAIEFVPEVESPVVPVPILGAVRVVDVRGMNAPEDREKVCYVGRPFAGWPGHVLANPFRPKVGEDAKSLAECLARYRKWLWHHPERGPWVDELWVQCQKGLKPLGCWCINATHGDGSPDRCHAQFLAALLHARFLS